MTSPLGSDGLRRSVGLVLHVQVLLLDPVLEFVALLSELLLCEIVAQSVGDLGRPTCVRIASIDDLFGLALDASALRVAVGDQLVGELTHGIHLVVVRLQRRDERLVLLDALLGALQAGR